MNLTTLIFAKTSTYCVISLKKHSISPKTAVSAKFCRCCKTSGSDFAEHFPPKNGCSEISAHAWFELASFFKSLFEIRAIALSLLPTPT